MAKELNVRRIRIAMIPLNFFIVSFLAMSGTEKARTQRTPVAGTARRPPQKSAKPRPMWARLVGSVKMKLAVSQLNRSQSYANWFVLSFSIIVWNFCVTNSFLAFGLNLARGIYIGVRIRFLPASAGAIRILGWSRILGKKISSMSPIRARHCSEMGHYSAISSPHSEACKPWWLVTSSLRLEIGAQRRRSDQIVLSALFHLVILLRIFLDHAVGGESRHERDHRAADALEPGARNALRVTFKKQRDDFFGEGLVKVRAVETILFFHTFGLGIFTDGKAIGLVITFAPPAVEDAQVHAAVAAGFHAARAGSFERTARVIQPDVAAAHHLARNVNIVIFEKHEVAREFAVFAEMNDLLDETFAFVIARVRFAGENKLKGALFVAREFDDVFELLENERRAFVSGEAAREADGQRVEVQETVEADIIAGGGALVLLEQAASRKFDEFAAQFVAQGPQFLVGNKFRVGHFFPKFGKVDRRRPVHA